MCVNGGTAQYKIPPLHDSLPLASCVRPSGRAGQGFRSQTRSTLVLPSNGVRYIAAHGVMVRSPCCEKVGLNRGPWTAEEDQILVSYIQKNGHGNWRALPKHAGLLRCGKSCRLRWINYLRPDIKRGNITAEEEETIINLHAMLGNRWSAIAAKLPGRTDNEIKNVWHTYLKKRVHPSSDGQKDGSTRLNRKSVATAPQNPGGDSDGGVRSSTAPMSGAGEFSSSSSSSSSSSVMMMVRSEDNEVHRCGEELPGLPDLDESFWTEALGMENPDAFKELPEPEEAMPWPLSPSETDPFLQHEDDMDFWAKLFLRAGESPIV